MALVNPPPSTAVDRMGFDARGMPSLQGVNDGFRNFFTALFTICNALTMSGTTALRPTAGLWVGRTYFDTTLGFPIWFDGTVWVDATGTPA